MFEGFRKIYKSKVNLADYDITIITIWHIALNELGMTQAEFNHAKRETLKLEWPPTAPKNFYNLACSEKYITAEQAFQIACQECGKMPETRNWTDVLIYEAARRYGTSKLARAIQAEFKSFKCVYEKVISEHKAGSRFDFPNKKTKQITVEPASQEFVDNLLKKYGWYKEKIA